MMLFKHIKRAAKNLRSLFLNLPLKEIVEAAETWATSTQAKHAKQSFQIHFVL